MLQLACLLPARPARLWLQTASSAPIGNGPSEAAVSNPQLVVVKLARDGEESARLAVTLLPTMPGSDAEANSTAIERSSSFSAAPSFAELGMGTLPESGR
jgi:hypothetical protein